MKKPTLYILCGLPFGGKTYLAKKIAAFTGSKFIAFDQLWMELEKNPSLPTPAKGSDGWRLTRNIAKERIAEALNTNQSVIYDDTNVQFAHRVELRELAEQCAAISIVIYVNTSKEIRAERMRQNVVKRQRHDAEPENLEAALSQFEEPTVDENVALYNQSMDLDEWMRKLTESILKITIVIDSSGSEAIRVALETCGGEIHELKKPVSQAKAQEVLPMIEKLLIEQELTLGEVMEIRVNTGHGSYTGLRVGIAIANMLGVLLGVSINDLALGQTVIPQYEGDRW